MRLVTILFAYACAATVAVIFLLTVGAVQSGMSLSGVFTDLRVIGLFVLAAAVYALPVALPVVLASEFRHYGDWKVFLSAGAVLGTLLAFLFAEIPFEWSNLRSTAPLVPIATLAALVYWLVAWKWMPPKNRASFTIIGQQQ